MFTLSILQKVDNERLMRATEGLASGAYTVTIAHQSEAEIRGFVANGDGKEYGVALSEGQAFCSCKDAMYRHTVCKHAVALALYTIRNQAEHEREATQPVTRTMPKLTKVRHEWGSRCNV